MKGTKECKDTKLECKGKAINSTLGNKMKDESNKFMF